MLRSMSRSLTLQVADRRFLCMTSVTRSNLPNTPLDLDPSLKTLLRDADMAILGHKSRHGATSDLRHQKIHELEVYPADSMSTDAYLSAEELDDLDEAQNNRDSRKSPAALFGSQRFGAIVMPLELQSCITKLIAGTDKPLLHVDAKRLFLDGNSTAPQWDASYDVKYKSGKQAYKHGERDGTAFASVALPSHYVAIVAVLDHVRQRLGPTWIAQHIIDWGAGTGSGLWAAAHVFQRQSISDGSAEDADPQIHNSVLATYVGLDKRDGLTTIGRRLLNGVNLGKLDVKWQRSFQEHNMRPIEERDGVLALSAFMLSTLQTPLARKSLVKEMWESGADTIVIIDHNTTAGFECIAEARESLLRMGKNEDQDGTPTKAAHVVAPCPHDRGCPLYHPGSSRLVCGFSQRLQRPEFLRRTKHSGKGHEDTGYSYVVIRRGPRPLAVEHKLGRLGAVGKREIAKNAQKEKPMVELAIESGHHLAEEPAVASSSSPVITEIDVSRHNNTEAPPSLDELQDALRSEAYQWPRLVFPPLKKSGHIILDGCTAEGKIMRMTIPKSQGKQPFYDARKSSWGDIFPHEPKNPPQERFGPTSSSRAKGGHARKPDSDEREQRSYSNLANDLKDRKNKFRQERKLKDA